MNGRGEQNSTHNKSLLCSKHYFDAEDIAVNKEDKIPDLTEHTF